MLLAVYRGKMSEGISFNDGYARGVLCVGIPFPSFFDAQVAPPLRLAQPRRMSRGAAVTRQ